MTAQNCHDFIQYLPLLLIYGGVIYGDCAIPFWKLVFTFFPIRLTILLNHLLTRIECIIIPRITYPSIRIHSFHFQFHFPSHTVFQIREQEIGRCKSLYESQLNRKRIAPRYGRRKNIAVTRQEFKMREGSPVKNNQHILNFRTFTVKGTKFEAYRLYALRIAEKTDGTIAGSKIFFLFPASECHRAGIAQDK